MVVVSSLYSLSPETGLANTCLPFCLSLARPFAVNLICLQPNFIEIQFTILFLAWQFSVMPCPFYSERSTGFPIEGVLSF